MVLLKGFSSDGFKFYTNYESRKGQELVSYFKKNKYNNESVIQRKYKSLISGRKSKCSIDILLGTTKKNGKIMNFKYFRDVRN